MLACYLRRGQGTFKGPMPNASAGNESILDQLEVGQVS